MTTQLATLFGQAESGNSLPDGPWTSNSGNSYANGLYQQFPGFVNTFGSGEQGILNYTNSVLAVNPNATAGDVYAGYFSGTGQPGSSNYNSFSNLANGTITGTPATPGQQIVAATNFTNASQNRGVDLNAPASSLIGTYYSPNTLLTNTGPSDTGADNPASNWPGEFAANDAMPDSLQGEASQYGYGIGDTADATSIAGYGNTPATMPAGGGLGTLSDAGYGNIPATMPAGGGLGTLSDAGTSTTEDDLTAPPQGFLTQFSVAGVNTPISVPTDTVDAASAATAPTANTTAATSVPAAINAQTQALAKIGTSENSQAQTDVSALNKQSQANTQSTNWFSFLDIASWESFLQSLFVRGGVVILGLIFIGVGLFMLIPKNMRPARAIPLAP